MSERSSNFTLAEKIAAAAHARFDLYDFSRWMLLQQRGFRWQQAAHHSIICNALENVYCGECKRLIINIPPRYSKTQLVKYFIAWTLGHAPDSEFIYTSYSGRLAANSAWDVREMVRSDAYREVFPNVVLRDDSQARDEWRTIDGGCVYAVGAGGTITGYGAGKMREGFGGCIVVDDPHKSDEARSDVMRQNVIDWFQNTLESRKNSPHTPIIVIMQRLHENDLSGWLLDGGNGEHWEHLCLPALSEDGVALWPEKHDVETLRKMEKVSRYVFAGQYQQRPSPLHGGLIKGSWFPRYKVLPQLDYRVIIADTAQKTSEQNDYSVFECWGVAELGKRAFLIDVLRGKWESADLKRNAKDFWVKHSAFNDAYVLGDLRKLYVEDKSSGTALIQDLSKEPPYIPVEGIQRTKDKLTRWMDAIPSIEAGFVSVPEEAPWLLDFIHECEMLTATMTHAHDDQVDPLCDAVSLLRSNALDEWARLAG